MILSSYFSFCVHHVLFINFSHGQTTSSSTILPQINLELIQKYNYHKIMTKKIHRWLLSTYKYQTDTATNALISLEMTNVCRYMRIFIAYCFCYISFPTILMNRKSRTEMMYDLKRWARILTISFYDEHNNWDQCDSMHDYWRQRAKGQTEFDISQM